jgi:acyl-CoA thioesterase-1
MKEGLSSAPMRALRLRYGVFAGRVNATPVLLVIIAVAVFIVAPPLSAAERHILVLGDSLTAGFGLPAADSFSSRLQAALERGGIEVVVHNAGVSGDTSAGGRARLEWALAGVPGGRPDLVLIELGANDALRGLDPLATEANLAAILAALGERRVPALLTGMKAPRNLGRDYVAAFEAIFPRLAERFRVPLYPFFLEGVATEPRLNQADGIHPNREGVEVIVAQIFPHVVAALAAAGAGR